MTMLSLLEAVQAVAPQAMERARRLQYAAALLSQGRSRREVSGLVFARYGCSRSKAWRLVAMAAAELGSSCDAQVHFNPRYNPWDQRVCVAPDGDMFQQIRAGRASVVTDTISRFTATGVQLASGQQLDADIVVLATGLQLNVAGDIAITVDGRAVVPGQALSYKGMMLGDVPNMAMAFGYTNASWTLKADLTAGWVCRLLNHLQRHGQAIAVPRHDPSVPVQPFLSFTSGYVQRAAGLLPLQGVRAPWQVHQSYLADLLAIRFCRLDDGVLQLRRAGLRVIVHLDACRGIAPETVASAHTQMIEAGAELAQSLIDVQRLLDA